MSNVIYKIKTPTKKPGTVREYSSKDAKYSEIYVITYRREWQI
jgi:hypothetical protein|nr:MAG TPA: hypothetical protein [Caudoviricetes sp.]